MGLADRDYMRERRHDERPFGPEPLSTRSTLWMVLFWVAFSFVCYKAWEWRLLRQTPATAAVSTLAPSEDGPSAKRQHPNLTGNWDPNRVRLIDPPQQIPSPPTQTITKCVVNGVVSYSHDRCGSNAQASTITVSSTQNLAEGLPPPSVPMPPLVVEQQRSTQASPPAIEVQFNKKAACDGYDEEIKRIDSMARQPQPGRMQDHLSARRKNVRDEQFRLHC